MMKKMDVIGTTFPVSNGAVPSFQMEVPDAPSLAEFVPAVDSDYVFSKESFSVVLNYLRTVWSASGTRDGLHLIGPTGSGKTSLPEQIMARLGVPMVSITGHERLEVDDLIYQVSAVKGSTICMDGPLTTAMEAGVPFVLNEIDLLEPGTLTGLNDIIERGFVLIRHDNRLVKAAKGFCFIVTSNTGGGGDETGLYAGTRVQNLAFRDRFQRLVVGYPSPETEKDILVKASGIAPQVAESFVKVAGMIRSAFEAGSGMDVTMSTRTLKRWAALAVMYKGAKAPVHLAVDLALAAGTTPAVSEAIHEMVTQVFGVSAEAKQATA